MHSPRSVQLVARKHHSKPPEGGCFDIVFVDYIGIMVSTHSRAKAAASPYQRASKSLRVSTHSRAKAAADVGINIELLDIVSTHSRAEAVALFDRTFHESQQCFNTQPPKGGCYTNFPSIPPPFFVSTHSHPKAAATMPCASSPILPFQHTAARRRLLALLCSLVVLTLVSTRSRAKAAALNDKIIRGCSTVSTHSRVEAAAFDFQSLHRLLLVSTHSRVEAAAKKRLFSIKSIFLFQHTAAWRRLPGFCSNNAKSSSVSTHSRVEAAASLKVIISSVLNGFNTQPRGGGCEANIPLIKGANMFQHTAARRRLQQNARCVLWRRSFNTQPRGGGCRTAPLKQAEWSEFQHTAARRRLPERNVQFAGNAVFQHTAARRRLL